MKGLGIDAIRQVAGDSNEELNARLEATSRLSKAAIWQLRHPIDMGRIFDGRELGRTRESHVATFTAITSVPAELVQNRVEPPLYADTSSTLFSIAHNALTNAFRHAEVSLFREYVRLNVQRFCPFMSSAIVAGRDLLELTAAPTISGVSAAKYFLTVFLLIPRFLAIPQEDTP